MSELLINLIQILSLLAINWALFAWTFSGLEDEDNESLEDIASGFRKSAKSRFLRKLFLR